jgi:aconitase A
VVAEWAECGQRFRGVKVVLANSCGRILRLNLIVMGILPLQLHRESVSIVLASPARGLLLPGLLGLNEAPARVVVQRDR